MRGAAMDSARGLVSRHQLFKGQFFKAGDAFVGFEFAGIRECLVAIAAFAGLGHVGIFLSPGGTIPPAQGILKHTTPWWQQQFSDLKRVVSFEG
jgi:hypothetical protein